LGLELGKQSAPNILHFDQESLKVASCFSTG